MKRNHKKPGGLNIAMLVITGTSSAILASVLYFLYKAFRSDALYAGRMPLLMGAVFALFLLLICTAVFSVSNAGLDFAADIITGKPQKSRIPAYLILGLIICFLFMTGAEFIYERNFVFSNGTPVSNTYVFLIDDSGSMDDSDPDLLRYGAIEEILSQKSDDTSFAVYSFSNTTELTVPMRTVSQGFPDNPVPAFGMTNMKDGLERVIRDYEKGAWKGSSPSLIIITDGWPSDFDSLRQVKPLLDRFVKHDISIGIVGVLGANNSLMNDIADYTGGSFTDISDVSQLAKAVGVVAAGSAQRRDLLSLRAKTSVGWLYALIRILAFFAAGSLLCIVATLCYGNSYVSGFMLRANIIKSFIAGLLMEAAFLLPAANTAVCLLAWTVIGTIITKHGQIQSEPDNRSSSRTAAGHYIGSDSAMYTGEFF